MSRIGARLSEREREGRAALVSFITAGDPSLDVTVPALHALVAGGVDVLELGIPFSDPEAEGPAIQRSSERALGNGMTLSRVLDMVQAFRRDDDTTPIVLMGYLNSLLRMGVERFAETAQIAGVDGLIMVNLPPEEAGDIRSRFERHDLDLILLVAPTTTDARARVIVDAASGFVYYVSLKGVTGADHLQAASIRDRVVGLKEATNLPIMVGFGIKDAVAAREVAVFADGVVVGSALVNTMAQLADEPGAIPGALTAQAHDLRVAIDEARGAGR